jgi:hypothetical protein
MSALGERPRQCPVELLEPGDVIEVPVYIEDEERVWVTRTVLWARELPTSWDPRGGWAVRYEVPEGWEGGGEYTREYLPGKTERLAYVDAPLVWEGDGA